MLATLDDAAAAGLNVMRTWAFNDGLGDVVAGGTRHALQPRAREYDEQGFVALDRVVAEVRRRGIRVILTLVNGCDDYGGMRQYVQ